MNTDTPRTDDKESRIQCDLSSMKLDGWNAAYHEMKEHAQELERELTAVTEQRDRLADALRKFVGDALFCSYADTAKTVLPHQQVNDSGDALTMP